MKQYRCPYCGKKSYTLLKKLGLSLGYPYFNYCFICKKESYRNMLQAGYGVYSFVFFLSIILVSMLVLLNNVIIFLITLFLIGAIAISINYLSPFDIRKRDRCKFEYFKLAVSSKTKLFPRIRFGDVCILVPEEVTNPTDELKQTVAFLDKIEKGSTETELTFRLIKKPVNSKDWIKDKVKIMNDYEYLISGYFKVELNVPDQ